MALLHRAAQLNERSIVLASGSPRRNDLMRQLGLTEFTVVPSHFAEDLEKDAYTPEGYVIATALGKAREVQARLLSGGQSIDLTSWRFNICTRIKTVELCVCACVLPNK